MVKNLKNLIRVITLDYTSSNTATLKDRVTDLITYSALSFCFATFVGAGQVLVDTNFTQRSNSESEISKLIENNSFRNSLPSSFYWTFGTLSSLALLGVSRPNYLGIGNDY